MAFYTQTNLPDIYYREVMYDLYVMEYGKWMGVCYVDVMCIYGLYHCMVQSWAILFHGIDLRAGFSVTITLNTPFE